MEKKFIPARYIGSYPVQLKKELGPYKNIDGSVRTELTLEHGDTLMMPDVEVLGQTLFLPENSNIQEFLGAGRVVKPEHADLSEKELQLAGYSHQMGRADFEPVEASLPTPKQDAASNSNDGGDEEEDE